MSGCQEGILIDISDGDQMSQKDGFKVTDSIEYFRDDQLDIPMLQSPEISSPAGKAEKFWDKTPPRSVSLNFIEAETFDFDLPATPETSSEDIPAEDDEEVFFGPVGFRERCVKTVVDSATKEVKPLSPLNPRQMAEIFKEANAVAERISSAYREKNSKAKTKESISCAKQLKLGENIFRKDAIVSLLKSSTRGHKLSDDDDKENCDIMDCDGNIAETKVDPLERFRQIKEKLAIHISPVKDIELVDIEEETKKKGNDKPEEMSVEEIEKLLDLGDTYSKMETGSGKSSESDNSDASQSPRKHNRSGTFTMEITPHEQLPGGTGKSLPVIEQPQPSSEKKDSAFQRQDPTRRSLSRLKPPSKLSSSPKKQAADLGCQPYNTEKQEVLKPAQSKLQKSRLSAPKASSLLPSKLKSVATNGCGSGVSMATRPSQLAPPSFKPSQLAGPRMQAPEIRASAMATQGMLKSKLQPMRPSSLQRPTGNKPGESETKKGPLKAFAKPIQQDEKTPAKVDKYVQPKNLSSSFSTPGKSGSTSSIESPASSVNKRRSCLPTPTKTRLSSVGSSIPSPCGSRSSSTSSCRSMDSPHMSTRSAMKCDLLRENTPSDMRSKRPPVVNTPNMPKKRLSQWSPVPRKPIDHVDQAFMCTKKLKR
ncbi:uncharacterized protein LOC128215810 isoform X1 [Mya arenaria]|uniref:uncharacterized protein LOC128215810 isoform X1 n=1 Tax=Mya arenaria TaxID=6604 RepID=UPI0022E0F1B5|nr:uncharacterized protein LOC128215810 isoform X1 [Mya arenaria]XP_052778375.1 uncharacterized protein LOC128215810 isoform X1 [Mya arenaria]XP_052778376.1 uncharacterized protein LOC128215810 isoform X1 [Mya arenaria]